MAFDKKKFKMHMKKIGMTQEKLAENLQVNLRTVSRWLDPKVRIKQERVTNLCEAVGALPTDFDETWEGPLNTKNVTRVNARVSSASKNGYWLLKKSYGVTETEICEIAPTLFALFAASIYETETSGEYRKSEAFKLLAEEYGYVSEDDARFSHYYPYDADYEAEVEKLLKKGAIFGDPNLEDKYYDAGYGPGDTNFFFNALKKRAQGSQLVKLSHASSGECPSGVGVAYDVPLTNAITGGDVELNDAISWGAIELFSSEFDNLNSPAQKLEWMKDKMQKWKQEREERMNEYYKKHPDAKELFEDPERLADTEARLRKKWELT